MLKILHYGLSSNLGGIETYLHKLWTHIDRSVFHFDFIDTNIGNPCLYDEFVEMGSNFYKVVPRKQSMLNNKKEMEEVFSRRSFDILHCHLNTLSYVEPINAALRHGCKVILHSRNTGSPKSLITKLLHHIHFCTLPKDKITMLAVSDLAGEWLFGKNVKFQTINNGVDINKFKFSQEKRERKRKELNIENNYVVGNVGAFLYPKNHKFLIKIFYELIKTKPESLLLLVGTGPLEQQISNMVDEFGLKQKVLFLGRRTDIPELFCAMDCLLFPSLYEGFPNSVLEAQTSGVPCLISNIITNEIVIAENCMRLPLNLSAEQWATKLLEIKNHQDRAVGSEIVKNLGYSVEEEVKKIESIYLKLSNNL